MKPYVLIGLKIEGNLWLGQAEINRVGLVGELENGA